MKYELTIWHCDGYPVLYNIYYDVPYDSLVLLAKSYLEHPCIISYDLVPCE